MVVINVCIDFETTSLPSDPNGCGIVQIAAMKWGGDIGKPITYETLINPELDFWSPKAIEVHGITPEKVSNSPTFFTAFYPFAEFVKGVDNWVGYNCSFDIEVLQIQLDRYGFTTHFPWPLRQIDVMQMADSHMNIEGKRGSKYPQLGEIYEHLFNKKLDGAHDAMVDVRATVDVIKELNNV